RSDDGRRRKCCSLREEKALICFKQLLSLKQQEADRVREEELEKLRQFDLDWSFGPCTGISRLQRWERAKLHGLNPPEEIRDLLLQTHADPEYNLGLWSGYPL
uniref:Uncharacterized protein n=1 Tax=Astatotilapia calliptera TaxID=8154 RepID=A0AAX7VAE9_ASTCA